MCLVFSYRFYLALKDAPMPQVSVFATVYSMACNHNDALYLEPAVFSMRLSTAGADRVEL